MAKQSATIEAPNIKTRKTSSAARLSRACLVSDKRLEWYRKKNLEMWKEFCGPIYAGSGTRQPINTFHTIISILVPNLVGTRVGVVVKTKNLRLRPFAALYKLALEHTLDRIQYGSTNLHIVRSSLLGAGITKTILDVKDLTESPDFPNWLQDAGFPYVGQITLDDYILDPNALVREAAAFEGNDYLIPIEKAYQSGMKHELLDKMSIAYHSDTHTDQAASISSREGDLDSYMDFFKVADIYLPYEDAVVTISRQGGEVTEYLQEKEYQGPDGGPYDMIVYQKPDSNALPVPPVPVFYDLHLLLNTIARKMARQAERSKTLLVYLKGKEQDGATINAASDGDTIGLSDTASTKEVTTGNVDPKLYQAVAFFRDLLNWVSNNPETIGGLAAGERTLGQDEMKLTQASARLAYMRALVREHNKKVLRKVAWYLWTDPATRIDLLQPAGQGLEIPRQWSPDVREGDFPDYEIDIEPFIASADDPMEQYRRTLQLMTQVLIPMSPVAQAQGTSVDMNELLQSMGEKLDIDVSAWLKAGEPMLGPRPGIAPNAGGEQGMAGMGRKGTRPKMGVVQEAQQMAEQGVV